MFSRFFIDRPIFAAVLSIVIMLGGGLAVLTLPVAQYPEITPPTVQVSTVYPGANAEVVADTVALQPDESVALVLAELERIGVVPAATPASR
jgi:multidrug efflux pump subunit AcrB